MTHKDSLPSIPELLAPAGDRTCLRAAVENGADAVYFGLENGFNARARATNMHMDELPEIMQELHGRGVKGYVTLNTLVFPEEFAAVEIAIRRLAEAHVDAVLVQDLGLVKLIKAISPSLSVHASTQMTLSSAECISVAKSLGIDRVVLPRELSIAEISKIREATESDIELEAFAHGALCVAYSGQCLTSESLGGRSANRGQCAQACRLPYDVIRDGETVDLQDVKYLLSPTDLAAYEHVPDMIQAGISCLKIEGRLKTPEYVANITSHYRRAIDAAVDGRSIRWKQSDVDEMALSFSRGFSPGWLEGCDHKRLVPGLSSNKRGIQVGHVAAIRGQSVRVELHGQIAVGDGVVFDGDRESDNEQGGRIYEIFKKGQAVKQERAGLVDLTFARNAIDFGQLWEGQALWKTDDPQLTQRLRKTFDRADPLRRIPVDLQVQAAIGKPIVVTGVAANGATCHAQSEHLLEAARKHALTEETLAEQLGRLGGTAFELRKLEADIHDQPMAPLSVIGKLRKEIIGQLENASITRPQAVINDVSARDLCAQYRSKSAESSSTEPGLGQPQLHLLCRNLAQLETALTLAVSSVSVDFQDIREYRQAVEISKAAGKRLFLATPRIQKPGEMGIFAAMARHQPDGFLVRNLAGIQFCKAEQIPFVTDFSLNAANALSVQFLRELGAQRVTVSYDLNRDQMLDVVADSPTEWLEIVIHQHMPMFHMEHCVFCAVLSPGTNKHNCGRPCDDHSVQMRDRIGMEHPLTADVGCRNTLFNAMPQSAAEAVPQLLSRQVQHFRLEFLLEEGQQVKETTLLYQRLLRGEVSGQQVWQNLKASNRVGVTRGTLEERRNPLAIL